MEDIADEPDDYYYKFLWDITGYDACSSSIYSPTFAIPFKATEWHLVLDLSKINNIQCVIPCYLYRHDNHGPFEVTVGVRVKASIKKEANFQFEISEDRSFRQGIQNFWKFEIELPRKDPQKEWLDPKMLFICLELSSSLLDYQDPDEYWSDSEDTIQLSKDIKRLYESGMCYDLVLKVSNEEFKLHKCILASRWPYFVSKFGISESTTLLDLSDHTDLQANLLKHIFLFLYSGETGFMADVNSVEEWNDVNELASNYNLYRLSEKINPLAPRCDSVQMLQSYRIALEMTLRHANSDEPLGDYRAIEIPLKSSKGVPHIKFMDVRLYFKKEVFGYNWLLFSIVLGRLPENTPVNIKCKLYVIDKTKASHLLTEQNLLFDESTKQSFPLPDIDDYYEQMKKGTKNYNYRTKTSHRYHKLSDPIITFADLANPRSNFLHERDEYDPKAGERIKSQNFEFRFEMKLWDGETVSNVKHATCFIRHLSGIAELCEDVNKIIQNMINTDCTVSVGPLRLQMHKAILASRSEVFRKFFEAQVITKDLSLEVKREILPQFIQYLYSGKMTRSPENIEDLLKVATFYKMDRMRILLESKLGEE
ncbi:uncharacterized protein NPIL_206921 [Nephila pilipes]|uniref:BTB domain-containing protein n=1 Tax=Nephila pilipes TaxID=299642 RepID=A0A8X6N4L6_NEPPI|nr:uncharacterized protein NPIL_206921 [Nephila pilipes]